MTKEERLKKDQEKLISMQSFERELRMKGFTLIAGVDEVGRGPLAGPVVAAAVILPPDFDVLGIDDSKKLTKKKREELSRRIKDKAICYAFGERDHRRIDEINILEATKEAMRDAILGLCEEPQHIFIDALTLKSIELPQTGIIKGDQKSLSIAAASILAKVERDQKMEEYHRQYPYYAFDQNMGYGTKLHYQGLDSHGPCPIHRISFLRKYFEHSKCNCMTEEYRL